MKIVACIKQVPDVEGRIVVDSGAVSVEEMVRSVAANPRDVLAVEAALAVRDSSPGSTVTLVSLGGDDSEEILRRGLAMGADDALLIDDTALLDEDSSATAAAIAAAIAALPPDLVFCGQRADDTQAGLVGSYLAQILGMAVVRGVVRVAFDAESAVLTLHKKLERGDRLVVECPPPAVVTVETGVNTPRNATIKGVLKARRQEIARLSLADLGLTAEEVGGRVKMSRLTPPKPKMKGLFVPDSNLSSTDKLRMIMGGGMTQKKSDFLEGAPEDSAKQLVRFLKEQKLVRDEQAVSG
jgi:electron transfer flavoprotein beta subunit